MEEQNRFAEQMPQTIGRYKVQESIGFGAMGAVYKAFDPLIKRTLAIKTIRLDIPRQSPQYKSFIERFYHEARISGTLSHPNIVTLFDIGEEGGVPYLAMEFVEGETIASMLEKGVRFHPEKVISLVSQIASALDYAHTKGVIHRDIKPSNVILFDGDRVKVTDFGIAKLVNAEMTQGGTLLGTPSYMSPEQAMGEKLDGRTDIFSLGVCAFEMLSGEQPFPGNNVTSILYKLVHVDPVEPPSLEMNGLVPQKWHEVFGRVLAKRPDDRYQTASEFVQDLEYCLGSWFGAAVGDDTLAERGAVVTDATVTVSRAPGAAAVRDDSTLAGPVASAPKPPPLAAKAPQEDPSEATLLVKASPPPKPAPPVAPPIAAPVTGATVLMSGTPTAAQPKVSLPEPPAAPVEPEDVEATVVIKGGKRAPVSADTRPAPVLSPSQPPPEKTVMMDAAQLASMTAPPVRTPPPLGATTVMPPPAPVGNTVMMDVTVKADRKAVAPPEAARPPVAADAERRPPKAPPAPAVVRAPATPPPPPPAVTAPAERPPAHAPPGRGSSAVLIVGVLALLVVLVAVVAGILVWRRLQTDVTTASPSPAITLRPSPTPASLPSPSPVPTPAAPAGSLHVETQPPGASVSVNGSARGVTPLDVPDLPLGTYEVKVELKGYDTKTQNVELKEDAAAGELKLSLTRPTPMQGIADVLSTPFGAEVSVDGTRAGLTPLVDFKLKPGTHKLDVEKEGYEPHSETVKIDPGKRIKLDVQLRAFPKATPAPTPRPDFVDTSKIYSPSEVDSPARKLSGQSVSYPENAPRLHSGDSVSVILNFVVNEQGDVADLKVIESGGKILDEAVLAAVRGWKYQPAVKKNVKVKAGITFKQTFRAG